MGPAPMTARRDGRCVSSNTFSLVRKPASRRPGTSGWWARAPVAMTAFLNESRVPLTSTVSGPVKRASPRKTSTPSPLKRSAES